MLDFVDNFPYLSSSYGKNLRSFIKTILDVMGKKLLLFFFAASLILPPSLFGSELPGKAGSISLQQVASFKIKKNAKQYREQLRKEGNKAIIKKVVVNGGPVYRVFIKKPIKQQKIALAVVKSREKAAKGKASGEQKNPEKLNSEEKTEEGAGADISYVDKDGDSSIKKGTLEDKPVSGQGLKAEIVAEPKSALYAGEMQENTSAERPAEKETESGDLRSVVKEVEISRFENKGDAEKFVQRVTEGGHEAAVKNEVTKDGKTLYNVVVLTQGEQAQEPQALSSGTSGTAQTSGELSAQEEPPVGTSKTSREAFEKKTNFIHGAVSLTGIYTDNALSTNSNKTSGYGTILTPEIWILLPRVDQRPLVIEDSSARSADGLLVSRLRPEVSRRYYVYFLSKADIPVFSKNIPSANNIAYDAEGRFIYNVRDNLSFDFIDQFNRSFETRATSVSVAPGGLDRYDSNLVNAMVHYNITSKINLRFDYSNFMIFFDDPAGEFRNRVDNAFSGYLFYKVRPKTSIFLEGSFTDIGYKNGHQLDSREYLLTGGLQWNMTAKSVGSIKVGYGLKDFDNVNNKSRNLVLEVQVRHRLSPKRSITLTGFRKTEESDLSTALFVLSSGMKIDYLHLLSAKLSGSANFAYTNDKYNGTPTSGDSQTQLEDNMYQAGVGLQYKFNKWLKSDVGYTFMLRDSNVSQFNYTSNTVFLRITGSL